MEPGRNERGAGEGRLSGLAYCQPYRAAADIETQRLRRACSVATSAERDADEFPTCARGAEQAERTQRGNQSTIAPQPAPRTGHRPDALGIVLIARREHQPANHQNARAPSPE